LWTPATILPARLVKAERTYLYKYDHIVRPPLWFWSFDSHKPFLFIRCKLLCRQVFWPSGTLLSLHPSSSRPASACTHTCKHNSAHNPPPLKQKCCFPPLEATSRHRQNLRFSLSSHDETRVLARDLALGYWSAIALDAWCNSQATTFRQPSPPRRPSANLRANHQHSKWGKKAATVRRYERGNCRVTNSSHRHLNTVCLAVPTRPGICRRGRMAVVDQNAVFWPLSWRRSGGTRHQDTNRDWWVKLEAILRGRLMQLTDTLFAASLAKNRGWQSLKVRYRSKWRNPVMRNSVWTTQPIVSAASLMQMSANLIVGKSKMRPDSKVTVRRHRGWVSLAAARSKHAVEAFNPEPLTHR